MAAPNNVSYYTVLSRRVVRYYAIVDSVRPYVRTKVTKCHQEQTTKPRRSSFGRPIQVDKKMCLSIFIEIVNVFDLHFQGQSFESNAMESSHVIMCHTVTDWTINDIADKRSRM